MAAAPKIPNVTCSPPARARARGRRIGAPLPLLVALFAGCGGSGGDGTGGSTGDDSAATTTATTSSSTTDAPSGTTMPADTGTDGSSTGDSAGSSDGSSTDATDATSSSSGGESTETGAGDCIPLLVEAFYDADAPSDNELQWVKLYNPCDVDFDLSTWSVGYARGELGDPELYTAGTKAFIDPPTLGAGDCFVFGGPTSDPLNGDPDYEYPEDFAPGLFAPDTAGAGVALFDVAVIDVDSVPRDAVVYGANNDNGLVDESGQAVAVPHVAGSAVGGSIRRTSSASTWEAAASPTPNVCPPF